ncbi:MAG: hypothetical protein GF334_11020 [Candidatus Altiarchaeales archaeon]|nr:hypothetical protein [Candidatus Altiarchaeales archaeon]
MSKREKKQLLNLKISEARRMIYDDSFSHRLKERLRDKIREYTKQLSAL